MHRSTYAKDTGDANLGRENIAHMVIDEREEVMASGDVFKRKLRATSKVARHDKGTTLHGATIGRGMALLRNVWIGSVLPWSALFSTWRPKSTHLLGHIRSPTDLAMMSATDTGARQKTNPFPNEEHFGNVNLEIRKLEAQLAQAREVNQKKEILGDIREWTKCEEILWWQWAQSNYLKYGDSNT
ncbi:hypothetical protein Cgig2_011995 [Carnegiea gigantea]|uniref:Uncharacterized protein n=1 Tax=Carnegiea gigantea TaxID=171969 RepID=A0A9Q1KQC5_9CARY|nr:hypothetical protein Cgig2_011995 [Carnegiea gigantea]